MEKEDPNLLMSMLFMIEFQKIRVLGLFEFIGVDVDCGS